MLAWLSDWLDIVAEYMPELMLGVTGIALVVTLVLTGLELFVIHAFCRYCLVSAVIVVLMFVLAVGYLRQETADG